MAALTQIFILGLAVGAAALTISKSKVFYAFRVWLMKRNRFLGDLINCPYCTGHWLAFAAVAFFQPRPVSSGFLLVDLAAAAFAIIAIAAFTSGLIYLALADLPPPPSPED